MGDNTKCATCLYDFLAGLRAADVPEIRFGLVFRV